MMQDYDKTSLTSISIFDVQDNRRGGIYFKNLLQTLSTTSHIQYLRFANCNLGEEEIKSLSETIRHIPVVRLEISDNFLTDTSMEYLSQFLQSNTALKELDLSGAWMTGRGLNILWESLSQYIGLTYLNLSKNHINQTSLVYIHSWLFYQSCLKHLVLRNCEISNIGARSVGLILQQNKSIEIIDLLHNEFNAMGCRAIASALYKNTTLKGLMLCINAEYEKGLRVITQALAMNNNLHYLTLNNCGVLHPDQLVKTVRSLISNPNLVAINMEYKMDVALSSQHIESIVQSVRKNPTILRLSLNDCTPKAIEAILKTSRDQFHAACQAICPSKEPSAQDQSSMMNIDLHKLRAQLWCYTQAEINEDIVRHKYLEISQELPGQIKTALMHRLNDREQPSLYLARLPVEITCSILAKLSEKQLITCVGKISLPARQQ